MFLRNECEFQSVALPQLAVVFGRLQQQNRGRENIISGKYVRMFSDDGPAFNPILKMYKYHKIHKPIQVGIQRKKRTGYRQMEIISSHLGLLSSIQCMPFRSHYLRPEIY